MRRSRDVGASAVVTEPSTHRDQHYVPRVYLKRWVAANGRLFLYRTLVSHPRVSFWKQSSIRGVAYHSHLYTRAVTGGESDEIEQWLDREIEEPAEEALQKAVSGFRLTPADWRRLVRFLAAQDVRTPARLLESNQRWAATLPSLIEDTVQRSVDELEVAARAGEPLPEVFSPSVDYLPFRVTTEVDPDKASGRLLIKAELLAGRALWLYEIRHLVTTTADVLHQHKWTIVSPPDDLVWFTSDDPVVRLNFYGPGSYDFKGGWGSSGTEIFLPLSPRHLLYTQVGNRPPVRGEVCARGLAEGVRRFIAEHAYRIIIAAEPVSGIEELRPRSVNAAVFKDEKSRWHSWHENQSAAERELLGSDEGDPNAGRP